MSKVVKRKSRLDEDRIAAQQIVNNVDNFLGYVETFRQSEGKHEPEDQRVSEAINRRPSALKRSVSRGVNANIDPGSGS